MKGLVLSLFPGIDLFGRAFEAEGFTVVRGPDLLFGGDIREFRVPPGRFDGVIGGPPCQQFSRANRRRDPARGSVMLDEYCRVVSEACPSWWLMENVACVPDVTIPGFHVQRIDVNALEFGLEQNRLRHFQFGSRPMRLISVVRQPVVTDRSPETCALASEARRVTRRRWEKFCELQGLPSDYKLPGFTIEAAYRAVGNGVPLPMGRAFARAIASNGCIAPTRLLETCKCGCGRQLRGKQIEATQACRKRMQRRRDAAGIRLQTRSLFHQGGLFIE